MAKFDFISLPYGKMNKKLFSINQQFHFMTVMYIFSSKCRYTEIEIWFEQIMKKITLHIYLYTYIIYVYYVKYDLKYIYKMISNYYPI